MSKTKILVLTIIFLICTLGAVSLIKRKTFFEPNKSNTITVSKEEVLANFIESGNDKKIIQKVIEDVFDAYNSADNSIITITLHKYIDPDQCKRVFDDIEDDMNSITVNGITIFKDGIDLRDNKFILVDHFISVFSDKAVVTGYVNGSVSIPGKEVEKGPWKISCMMYKNENNWFIGYIKLIKIDIIKLEYYVQLPKNYRKDSNKKWPLIVFLHGAGERGGTLDDVKKMNHSIPMMASTSKDFPFIAVSPLCPPILSWTDLWYSVNDMIDEVTAEYNIDTDRIYLTGLSLGGMGTWSIALQFPDKFAAIAPVCGTVDPDKVEKLKYLPIWAFHGAKDTIVPMDQEQKAVDILKACGSNIKYTVYPDVTHDAWNKAYTNKELYTWLLQHTRTKNKSQK